ncbi:ankyrin repeat domain-containing protein [Ruegeria aquimaris]|uniref:Ankyrin repeat domain-containing protein n=1 Tax=Ruegeria aquimaris TaxID=2984333 RepID=A0ABT3APT5_9RHOB|nr:ankyrin repeat domain-containing protein [Ruegeria sp. XHP0148]MCV2890690.1 ankyrin repeat domain-containing protein [Ruegeria sp. XHP0148]
MRIASLITCAALTCSSTAIAGPLHDAARTGDTAEIEALLESGLDVDTVEMVTPLLMAALSNQLEAVRLLLSKGADPDIASSAMGTALHAAAQRGFADIVRVLLDAGANLESRNPDRYTPLMIAALNNRANVVAALLEAGADIDAVGIARDNGMGGNGKVNALHVASFKGETDVSAILREAGAGPRPIDYAADAVSNADPQRGRQLANQWCGSCHKVESEDEVIIKPEMGLSLVGIIGRPVASRDDYDYFPALSKVAEAWTWTPERLYSFAAEPMLTIPGTRMRWNDGWTEADVAHIVAYFVSASN